MNEGVESDQLCRVMYHKYLGGISRYARVWKRYNAGINSGKENARTSARTLVVQAYDMDETGAARTKSIRFVNKVA